MTTTAGPTPVRDICRPTVREAVAAMGTELSRTQALLSGLSPAGWQRPTPCAGWTVHDVVAHMIGQNEELASPARLIRRVRRARALPGTGVLDRHNRLQLRDRAGASGDQLLADLGYWGPRAARAAARIPAPVRQRVRLSLCFPEARRMAEDSLDFLVRVMAVRDAWMHRADLAYALGRAQQLDAHDAQVVRQVVRDLAAGWSGPLVILHLTGPAGGRWAAGELRAAGAGGPGDPEPAATVSAEAGGFLQLLSGRAASPPAVTGDAAVAAALLATHVEF